MPEARATPVTATTITPAAPVAASPEAAAPPPPPPPPAAPAAASHEAAAPTTAAEGRVKLQESAIRPTTPQCTPASRRPAPAPRIEPVPTCVVDSGRPVGVEAR